MRLQKVTLGIGAGLIAAALTACAIPSPPASGPASGPAPAASPTPSRPTTQAAPTASPTPTPLSPSRAASPGAGTSLAVLPDTRTGTQLDAPLLVRGLPLINRNHRVTSAFVPKISPDFQLAPEADQAFGRMLADSKKAGVAIIWRVGYRSYETQQALSATPPTQYGDDAANFVAKPGQSEHQAGLAVDVASEKGYGTRFPETKEFAWLRANSYKYGFILRYPDGKAAITGYNYEPWHYRYVGVAAAAAFGPSSTLTLEEYLGGR